MLHNLYKQLILESVCVIGFFTLSRSLQDTVIPVDELMRCRQGKQNPTNSVFFVSKGPKGYQVFI